MTTFEELASLCSDWDGHGAPAPASVAIANARVLAAAGAPDRIVADADGGVVLYYFGGDVSKSGSHRMYAGITCDNGGEITLMLSDRGTGRLTVVDVKVDDPLLQSRIRAFLFGEGAP